MEHMVRPCFLVVDREFPGSISTRKLVIETAKFNVLTAYSGREALETVRLFPNLSGVVLDADVTDIPCSTVIEGLRAIRAGLPVIVIAAPGTHGCHGADHELESFDPRQLLGILQTLQPTETAEIEKRNEDLARGLQ
jgi:DNA-binding response OmpR family regulator